MIKNDQHTLVSEKYEPYVRYITTLIQTKQSIVKMLDFVIDKISMNFIGLIF